MKAPKLSAKELAMAKEWARELGKAKYNGMELFVAEVIAWGFAEVDRGRPPDTVLKEMLAKCDEQIAARPN